MGTLRTRDENEVEEERSQQKTDECECGCEDIVETKGEKVCAECGLVLAEDRIDPGPEWRAFTENERNNVKRTGSPVTNTMHDRGMSTKPVDFSGCFEHNVDERRRSRVDSFIKTDDDKQALRTTLGEVQRIISALGLHREDNEHAADIVWSCWEQGLQGTSCEAIAAAAVRATVRMKKIPITMDEVVEVMRTPQIDNPDSKQPKKRQRLNTAYSNRICSHKEGLGLEIPPPDPQTFVSRFRSDLQEEMKWVSREDYAQLEQGTRQLIEQMKSRVNGHTGRSPADVVAGSIYVSARFEDIYLTQKNVERCSSIPNVSCSGTIRQYEKMFNQEFDRLSGTTHYRVEGVGRVRGELAEDFAQTLLNYYPEDRIEVSPKHQKNCDFKIGDVLIDIEGSNASRERSIHMKDWLDRHPEYTYIVLGHEEFLRENKIWGQRICTWDEADQLASILFKF